MNCCEPEDKDNQTPTIANVYRYSFRNAKDFKNRISLLNTKATKTSSLNGAIPNDPMQSYKGVSYFIGPTQSGVNPNDDMDGPYRDLMREEEQLQQFIETKLKPLENEITFYENEIVHRDREIRELNMLLQYCMDRRRIYNINYPNISNLAQIREPFLRMPDQGQPTAFGKPEPMLLHSPRFA